MYHCYLRGKQYELLAIRSCLDKIVLGNIIPIIEPVRESTRDLYSCLKETSNNNVKPILVANPHCGELENSQLSLDKIISGALEIDPQLQLAYIVNSETTLRQLQDFISNYPNQIFSIIHYGRYHDTNEMIHFCNSNKNFIKHIFIDSKCSHAYKDQFIKFHRVLIQDGFSRRNKNADYADSTVEFFSDLYLTYQDDGYQGFGDFSVIGDYFSEGGGQAITAAIHLTYNSQNDEILIHHFLSDERSLAEDVQILIEEALSKLTDFIENDRPDILKWSTACKELIDIYKGNNKTNLAYMKKMILKHHFELMRELV